MAEEEMVSITDSMDMNLSKLQEIVEDRRVKHAAVYRVTKSQRYLIFELNRLLSSVQFSRSVVSEFLRPHEPQHARPPCPSPSPGVHSASCPSSP